MTPELIAAAKTEGKIILHVNDVPLAEKIAEAFEAKYSGIKVQVERTGAERVFQRIGQEYGAASTPSMWSTPRMQRISSPGSRRHPAAHVPEDVAKFYPQSTRMPMASSPASASA